MNRILTWHREEAVGNETRIGPTYYIEADYTPIAVRIHAQTAPLVDAQIDIFDDGVSIFNSRAVTLTNLITGVTTVVSPYTTIVLVKGDNSDEMAQDFSSSLIEEGSWVHCTLKAGGGKNISVHLELSSLREELEEEE